MQERVIVVALRLCGENNWGHEQDQRDAWSAFAGIICSSAERRTLMRASLENISTTTYCHCPWPQRIHTQIWWEATTAMHTRLIFTFALRAATRKSRTVLCRFDNIYEDRHKLFTRRYWHAIIGEQDNNNYMNKTYCMITIVWSQGRNSLQYYFHLLIGMHSNTVDYARSWLPHWLSSCL